MSTAATPASGHHDHPPHLAHHFETPEQQFSTGKLGMWIFLATEILMFGGLFCAYAVYRHNHYDVFQLAHQYLNKWLGGLNTIVLITSSLTMAWGVRAAQLGQSRLLAFLLALTFLGGFGFMGIKAIEYRDKWHHHVFIGEENKYRPKPDDTGDAVAPPAKTEMVAAPVGILPADPNAGTPNAAGIRPPALGPQGLASAVTEQHRVSRSHDQEVADEYARMASIDRKRVYTFFGAYFVMTGLHGIHVLVGMGLIFWILMRAVSPAARKWVGPMGLLVVGLFFVYVGLLVDSSATLWTGVVIGGIAALGVVTAPLRARRAARGAGEFGPQYFLPVDLVGLYWHLVDLIWIFLFPLLYLIK